LNKIIERQREREMRGVGGGGARTLWHAPWEGEGRKRGQGDKGQERVEAA